MNYNGTNKTNFEELWLIYSIWTVFGNEIF